MHLDLGSSVQFSSVAQSCPTLRPYGFAARQASPSINNSRSLLRLMSIKSVMPSNHLILCHSLLLLPSIFPSIRVFSNESVLHIRWPKYCSFSFSISPPVNIPDWFPLGWTGWISWLDLGKRNQKKVPVNLPSRPLTPISTGLPWGLGDFRVGQSAQRKV